MASRVANATGNYGTAATWNQVTNTPSIHASTNTTISTSDSFSATFTAPNTTNAANGLLVYLVNKAVTGSPTTITATLQDTTVDTSATATITLASVNTGWIFFKVGTPYVFLGTGAGRYRWKIVCDTGTVTLAANSGATNFAYESTDNRNSVPVATEVVKIIGSNNQTAVTVTMDGTRAGGANVAAAANDRSVSHIIIGNGGTLDFDTSASTQLTAHSQIIVAAGGQYSKGTAGVPYPSSRTSTTIYDMALTGQGGLLCLDNGKVILQGAPKSSTSLWKTHLSSGVGTAASPAIMSESVDWSVGDEVLISPTNDGATNYQETESRFIITKNSATSYVWSATSGGAEAALTYTHASSCWVLNVQRNVIEKGVSTAKMGYFHHNAQTSAGNVDVDWVRYENIDASLFFGAVAVNFVAFGNNTNCDYSVCYYAPNTGFAVGGTSTTGDTYTGLITYSTGALTGGIPVGQACGIFLGGTIATAPQKKNLVDCFVMQHAGNGFIVGAGFSNSLTRCYAFACNQANTTNAGGFFVSSSGQNNYVDCESHANRSMGLVNSSVVGDVWQGFLCGTEAINQTTDIIVLSSTYNSILFDSCTFGSATLISNYANQTIGSEIRFHRRNDTDNQHRWYTVYGYGESESTVIRSPGLSVKLVPENLAVGFTWQFQIPTTANSIASFRGFFLKNATLGTGVVTVGLYLPGNPPSNNSPDDSATLSNLTGASFSDSTEQSVNLNATYTGDIPGVSVVTVNVKSNTAGAYLYADDFFNAGDRDTTFDQITGLNTWVDGKPIGVIQPSVPSASDNAAATWNYPTASAVTSGTFGTFVKKLLTVAKFLGLK